MEIGQLSTLVQAAGDDDPIVGLTAVARARGELARIEAVHVRRARNAGMTWAGIAAALGISKQAVHKKYGRGKLLG